MKNILTLTITIGPLVCSIFSWYFLFPLYLKDMGASDRTINVLYFLFNLTFYIAQIPGGILSDKLGRKPIVAGTTLVYALAGYGMAHSESWISASLFYVAATLSSSVQMPALYALLFESQNKKGLAFGLTSFSYNLGLAFGPIVGALLLEKVGIRGLLLIYSLTATVVGLVRWLFLEETLNLKENDSTISLAMNKTRLMTIVGGTFFFLCLTLTINGPYISLFQKENLKLSEQEINTVFAQTGIASAIGSLIFSKIIDNLNPAKVWAISSLLHPLTLMGWAVFNGLIPLLMTSAILAEIAYIAYPIFVSSVFEERSRGKGLGLFGFITGSLGSFSPLILNLFNTPNPNLPFLLATLFGFLSFSVIIILGGDSNESK